MIEKDNAIAGVYTYCTYLYMQDNGETCPLGRREILVFIEAYARREKTDMARDLVDSVDEC